MNGEQVGGEVVTDMTLNECDRHCLWRLHEQVVGDESCLLVCGVLEAPVTFEELEVAFLHGEAYLVREAFGHVQNDSSAELYFENALCTDLLEADAAVGVAEHLASAEARNEVC